MKIDRLVSIIIILLNKERIGAQELADMFEVYPAQFTVTLTPSTWGDSCSFYIGSGRRL